MDTGNRRPATAARRGHTLLELILALAVVAVLMVAMGSAIMVTTRAIDDRGSTAAAASETGRLMDLLTRDLRLALNFSERTATAVTFTVPDRDDDGDIETIRYAWTAPIGEPEIGTGTPLTMKYNDLDEVVIAERVRAFDLSYIVTTIAGTGGSDENTGGSSISILMVTDRDDGLDAQEALRKFLLESWGYTVTTIKDDAWPADYDAAFPLHDVVYVSDQINPGQLDQKLTNAPIGVVVEHKRVGENLFLLSEQNGSQNWASFVVADNSHYITEPFFAGLLPVLTEQESMLFYDVEDGEMGDGVTALGNSIDDEDEGICLVIETGDPLYGGAPAPGRRVILPWGVNIEFGNLNDNGRTILKRSLQWAANQEETDVVDSPIFAQFEAPTASEQEYTVDSDEWAMVSIVPDLPPDAVTWSITSFRFRARRDGDDYATLLVQVRGRNPDGSPTDDIVAQDFFSEESLPVESGWVTVTVNQTVPLPANEGAFISIGMLSGEKGAKVYYENGLGSATTANQFYTEVPNDWSTDEEEDMPCEVSGTYETSIVP